MLKKRKNHRYGGKINGHHTTTTDFSAEIIDLIEPIETVTRIILGVIIGGGGSRSFPRVRVFDTQTGFLLKVHGNGAIQDIAILSLGEDFSKEKWSIIKTLRESGVRVYFE